ncbi:receptor-like protein 9a [Manihot esculenta]|uniref:receptor-like protein 9a n=1 Tax=Manihot esculenta TaxID=3983 RepID=UPI001CC5A8AC|nr:receptor-like protein 9a [Manihot esculenta]
MYDTMNGSYTMNGSFPIQELSNLKNLKTLDVSYNQFNSSLSATGLCGLKSLVELDLRGNQLSGPLPECIGNLTNLQFLDLSFNQLSGNIQSIVSELTSLKYLLLSGNEFEGSFSFSALANHSKLEAFILSPGSSRLELETENPTWFPAFQLKYIQLSNCNLNVRTRAIPSFLRYQHDIRFIDLSHNKLVGTFPTWILQNNSNLGVINLGNNSFTGTFQLPNIKGDIINSMAGIDLSCNELSGSIPQEIGDLHEIRSLNLSHNHITGSIPVSFSNLRSLESLDLGNNNLSGEIPSELVALTFLVTFNVSYNNLSGGVPNGAQFETFDENNYRGNPGLCGEPIHKSCISDEAPQTPPPSADVEEEDEGFIDMLNIVSLLDLSRKSFSGSISHWVYNLSFGREGEGPLYGPFSDKLVEWGIRYGDSSETLFYNTASFVVEVDEESEFVTKYRADAYKNKALNYMSGLDLSDNT